MGAQVKDLIVLAELFTYSFLFHFRNSAKCAGDSDCFVSSGVRKGADNSRLQEFKERGTLTFFLSTQFFFILSEGAAKFILGLFN